MAADVSGLDAQSTTPVEIWRGTFGADGALGRIIVVPGQGVFVEKSISVDRKGDPKWLDVEPGESAWEQCMIEFSYKTAEGCESNR
jgi:hypothetical protein